MRKHYILSLLVLISSLLSSVTAQVSNPYGDQWKKIEQLEKKGLIASAQKEAQALFMQTLRDNKPAEEIKALLYIMKYRGLVEEDALFINYRYTDSLAELAKPPVSNILRSIQADLCNLYLQQNRYNLYSRTNLQVEDETDIRTWSIQKLINTSTRLFDRSLENHTLLQKTSLSDWEPILSPGNTRKLRPTLYDFLAHRALAFYMNEEAGVTKPSDRYIINDKKALAPAAEFIGAKFQTTDSSSQAFKAILMLQDILSFHIQDKEPDALFDADLIRIAFVYRKGQFDKKENLYEQSLQALESRLSGHPLSAEAMYQRASLYAEKGRRYQPEVNTYTQFDLVRAAELCQKALSQYPESPGGLHAKTLLRELQKPWIELETEKVNIPGLAFRSLLSYKNTDKVWLKLIRIDRKTLLSMNRKNNEEQWSDMNKLKEDKKWTVTLPNLKDMQTHSVEIGIDALTPGTYLLVASRDEGFGLRDNIMCRQVVYVSNISYISNNREDLYVLHRETGRPLPGAKVTLWESKYDYKLGQNQEKVIRELVADNDGKIKWKKEKEYRNYLLQVRWNNEELFTDESVYNVYYYGDDPKPDYQTKTYFFTDRSIYRPGQTLYFKGIMLENGPDNRSNRIVTQKKTRIFLQDVNENEIDSLDVITNEFGSFAGTFKLPMNGLGGTFLISDSSNDFSQSFQVEEYKRPKFFVTFDVPAGTYYLNDSIKVRGYAKAYAGNPIGGARVSYRVVRKSSYPEWFVYRNGFAGRPWFPLNETETEISNGTSITQPDGSFSIIYKAIPDESSDKSWQPVFHFDVQADVTDINGETRSGKNTTSVAYQALRLEIASGIKLAPDSIGAVQIFSRNINGIFNQSLVTVKAIPLISPDRYIRPRLWKKPDLRITGKEDFIQSFPHDPYDNEDQPANWAEAEQVWSVTDSTRANGNFLFPKQRLKEGWYKIIASAVDKYGEPVKAESLIRISSGNPLVTDAMMMDMNLRQAGPGEKVKYSIKSMENMYLLHAVIRPGNHISEENILLNKNQPFSRDITITESDRGGINLGYICVRYNRVMEGFTQIEVPWSNKELQISLDTYRDKMLPGSTETWSISISGKQADKKAAELLVNMYDQSLDQFQNHNWKNMTGIWPANPSTIRWTSYAFNSNGSIPYFGFRYESVAEKPKIYDALINAFQYGLYGYLAGRQAGLESVVVTANGAIKSKGEKTLDDENRKLKQEESDEGNEFAKHMKLPKPGKPAEDPGDAVHVRKNLQETAFFFPDLRTDSSGRIRFSFTMPEALTQWKFMALAHDRELASGYLEKSVITQKKLMVQPNAPRFVREGDRISLPVKVVNLSEKEINGTVQLELMDAATNNPVDGWFKNIFPVQHLSVEPGNSISLQFPVEVPASYQGALTWRVKAISADKQFSDGEEASIPVLANRMLVTETMPISLRHKSAGQFTFSKLLNNQSPSLVNQSLTVEYTSNPAWYAVQSLPYLMEFPHECAEQQFNRFFSNTLASTISNRHPLIRSVFEKWKNRDTAALLSNLEKNQELKSALLAETPWVMEARDEKKQKEQIALLFDLNRLAAEKQKTWKQISDMQKPNGSFSWFSDGPDNRYITQYIAAGFGHLNRLGALTKEDLTMAGTVISKAVDYLDSRIADDYRNLVRSKANLKRNQLTVTAIHYLYMRSFYPERPVPAVAEKAFRFYLSQATRYWLTTAKNEQAMIALAISRQGDKKTARAIIRSLKETAINNPELGMYWKDLARGGYFWNQAPLENQALMIEAFTETDADKVTIDNLKTWLLRQKQTRHWGSTKATAEACYALLLSGSDWLSAEKNVVIRLGDKTVSSQTENTEAGTGYMKKTFAGDAVSRDMGQISVTVSSNTKDSASSWGAVYWQYFENLDRITASASPLALSKKIFRQVNSASGPVLEEIKEGDALHIGDKVIARIIIKTDRDMEFLHLKDMRAACMEPVNVLSSYKWQGGLGYYESTKDAATHFFFDRMNRGTYVFEYPMFVSHAGFFSAGISSIQCMYAPEFSSHSEGISVTVEE